MSRAMNQDDGDLLADKIRRNRVVWWAIENGMPEVANKCITVILDILGLSVFLYRFVNTSSETSVCNIYAFNYVEHETQ